MYLDDIDEAHRMARWPGPAQSQIGGLAFVRRTARRPGGEVEALRDLLGENVLGGGSRMNFLTPPMMWRRRGWRRGDARFGSGNGAQSAREPGMSHA